jgi:nitroimidazol reductase NimA-like FMN-containing flavoprotein (pyridoxamine 5'-phosphate oxidase superfamily)
MNDKKLIYEFLDEVEFGTLAICADNKPYSLPINFARVDKEIYFHGSRSGRKIDILDKNSLASFSAVKAFSLIDSDFSSSAGLACPATQFFTSVSIDGSIEFVEDYNEKVLALSSLMSKLQPKGGYKPLDNSLYKKMIDKTTIYKLIPNQLNIKHKFGQQLPKERFDMIISSLLARSNSLDLQTVDMMKSKRDKDAV